MDIGNRAENIMDVRVATFFEDSKPSEARYNALTKFIR